MSHLEVKRTVFLLWSRVSYKKYFSWLVYYQGNSLLCYGYKVKARYECISEPFNGLKSLFQLNRFSKQSESIIFTIWIKSTFFNIWIYFPNRNLWNEGANVVVQVEETILKRPRLYGLPQCSQLENNYLMNRPYNSRAFWWLLLEVGWAQKII